MEVFYSDDYAYFGECCINTITGSAGGTEYEQIPNMGSEEQTAYLEKRERLYSLFRRICEGTLRFHGLARATEPS